MAEDAHRKKDTMRKTPVSIALAAILLAATWTHGIAQEHHVKAPLKSQNGTTASGFVQLTQMPKGGTNIVVVATGLTPGQTYTSFYYESADCTEPADKLATFVADDRGEGTVQGKIDDDLDEVGSVSVRLGEGFGELQACAQVH
jgi:hypothetical protein